MYITNQSVIISCNAVKLNFVAALGLDPRAYSPHSFRRGGATFAFECNVPAEHIKFQGDWRSDAYLVYLEMSPAQKRRAVNSMAAKINQLSSA